MANKEQQATKQIMNRRARFDYELGDSLIVGLQLTGKETKSLRLGHGQLRGSYVTVKDDELFLINMAVHQTSGIPIDDQEQTRTRKLLAKRKEIQALIAAKQQGKTLVPISILTEGRYIKLKLAVGKGKRQYDKRQTLKRIDDQRSLQGELKSRQRLS